MLLSHHFQQEHASIPHHLIHFYFIWQVMAFAAALESRKITVTTRQTRGLDASAACGQLRNKFQKSPLLTDSDNLQSQLDVAVACWCMFIPRSVWSLMKEVHRAWLWGGKNIKFGKRCLNCRSEVFLIHIDEMLAKNCIWMVHYAELLDTLDCGWPAKSQLNLLLSS